MFRLDRVDGVAQLPYSLKVLLENMLRNEDGALVTAEQVNALGAWNPTAESGTEVQFTPARVLLQDFTGTGTCVGRRPGLRNAARLHAGVRHLLHWRQGQWAALRCSTPRLGGTAPCRGDRCRRGASRGGSAELGGMELAGDGGSSACSLNRWQARHNVVFGIASSTMSGMPVPHIRQ